MGQITVEKNIDGIQGLCVITPAVHGDSRGYFMETYSQQDMTEAGFDIVFVQDNGQRELFAGEQLVELALGAHDGIDYGRYMDSRLDGNMMRQYRFALTYEGASKEVKDWFGRVVEDLTKKPEVKEQTSVTVQEEDERTDAEWDALAEQYDEIPY